MNQYVINDKTTANKWAITISDNELLYTITTDSASPEIILEDAAFAGTYYELYISDGELAFDDSVISRNDNIDLKDAVSGKTFRLRISDAEFNYFEVIPSGISVFIILRSEIQKQVILNNRIEKFQTLKSETQKQLTFNSLMSKMEVANSRIEKRLYYESPIQ